MDTWKIEATKIVYRGTKRQLPEFLPPFAIPVPRAWFDVLFLERKEKKQTVYTADAYAIATGYIVYDCEIVYTVPVWAEAMKVIEFAVQVEWAESARSGSNGSLALMKVSVFIPDQYRQKLEKQRTYDTTQGRFVRFLRSGHFADLEHRSAS